MTEESIVQLTNRKHFLFGIGAYPHVWIPNTKQKIFPINKIIEKC